MKVVMLDYLVRSEKEDGSFPGLDKGANGSSEYRLSNCPYGALYVPKNDDARLGALAELALRVVGWSHYLPKLGYPDTVWRPVVQRYERENLDRIVRLPRGSVAEVTPLTGVENPGDSVLQRDALGPELGAYRKAHPGVGEIFLTTSCGEDISFIQVRVDPPGGRASFIPTFFYDLCRARRLDPENPMTCRQWREPQGGRLYHVMGDYFFVVRWPDGGMRRGRLSVSGYDEGALVVLRR